MEFSNDEVLKFLYRNCCLIDYYRDFDTMSLQFSPERQLYPGGGGEGGTPL